MDGPDLAPDEALQVSELLDLLRERLDRSFGELRIEGEVGPVFRSRAGHLYFDLKDPEAQLRCVMFRSSARASVLEPEEGMLVRAAGHLDVFAARGSLQLVVDRLQARGEGALRLAFEQLKARLHAEGLFDDAHKKPLPFLPGRIGLVTSLEGAAVHDFLRGLRRRFPAADVLVYGARVQGEGAWREIVRGLHLLDARQDVDTLVVTRGGGSLEDLWNFNREELVRAIFELRTPLVSAIGHEVDVVLTDLVADARASTPTAAAEMVVPDVAQLDEDLAVLGGRLRRAQLGRLAELTSRLHALRSGLVHPAQRLAELDRRLGDVRARLDAGVRRALETCVARLGNASGRLDALSPLAVLGRGYSIARRDADGVILRAASDVEPGERIRLRLAHDGVLAQVIEATDG